MLAVHVFLNGERGVPVVRGLAEAGLRPAAVWGPPDRLARPEIAGPLAALEVACRGVADANAPDSVAALAAARPDVVVVAGFSTIFRDALLATPRLGTLNLHAGRLPHYRGGSPLNWQIINGEPVAGISVIRMDDGIDTGPVMAETAIAIGPDDDIATLHAKANALFPVLTVEAVGRLARGEPGVPQAAAEAAYWHQRNDADGRLDWRRLTARRAHDLVRAVTRPYSGAWTRWEDREVRVFRTSLPPGPPIRGAPGRVAHLMGRGPFVVCEDRALRLEDWAVDGVPRARLPHGAHLD